MNLKLNLRTLVELFKGSNQWEEVVIQKEFPAHETAILICDMWDKHWCKTSTQRFDTIAKKMVPVINTARAKSVQIIHSPSDCMEFYKDAPQRKWIQEIPHAEPPEPLQIVEPPLPIDDSDGGCELPLRPSASLREDMPPCNKYKAWTRQHPAIPIAENDVISDNGAEVYNMLCQRGIKNLIIMGVAANMCILGRSFGIRQMTRWGIRCILVRDLTDTMYNPKMAPFVSHDEGTELVVQHIEKYWCPSILSESYASI